jgi:hypothetical protein
MKVILDTHQARLYRDGQKYSSLTHDNVFEKIYTANPRKEARAISRANNAGPGITLSKPHSIKEANIMISNETFSAIRALNLDPIKVKLMHVESGEGWTRDKADAVEAEYRRFLYLMKTFPNEQTAPLVDVDTFWHYHILDTEKYAADCEHAFGYFLHHYPYVGMRGEDDEAVRVRSGERMRELYEASFGASYAAAAAAIAFCGVTNARPASCGVTTAAKPAFCGVTTAQPAFCGVTAAAKPAFCGVTAVQAAFCGITTAGRAQPPLLAVT